MLLVCTAHACADKYEGADMRIDSHWSEKKREHMTERDWRIFRRVGLQRGLLCGCALRAVGVACCLPMPELCCGVAPGFGSGVGEGRGRHRTGKRLDAWRCWCLPNKQEPSVN